MSEVIYEGRGIQLSRHTGPKVGDQDRRRWQVTTGPQGYAELDYEQWCAFAGAALLELARVRTPQFLAMVDRLAELEPGE